MKNPPDGRRDQVAPVQIPQDLSALERWVTERLMTGGQPSSYRSEESLEGREFSIETMTEDGMHRVMGITVARAGGDPNPAYPSEGERAVLYSVVRSLLDLVGHDWGPAITGVVLAESGPRVIACRLHREGGGRD